MQTLLSQPVTQPENLIEVSRAKPPKEASDVGSFRDAIDQATKKLEPDAPPPPPDSPPRLEDTTKTTDGTGEVKPNEPNAQANELDSKTAKKIQHFDAETVKVVELTAQELALQQSMFVAPSLGTSSAPKGIGIQANPTPALPLGSVSSITQSGSQVVTPSIHIDPVRTVPEEGIESGEAGVETANVRIRVLNSGELSINDENAQPAIKSINPKLTDVEPLDGISTSVTVPTLEATFSGDASSDSPKHGRGDTEAKKDGFAAVTENSATSPAGPTPVTNAKPESHPIDREMIARQLADKIELMAASRPKNGVVVMLEPAHLGAITMVLKGDKSDLQAQVYSENDRVREAIRQAHPSLVQHLGQRGVTLTSLAVSTDNSTSASLSSSNAWKQPNQERTPNQPSNTPRTAPSLGEAPMTIAQIRNAARNTQGVDIWI